LDETNSGFISEDPAAASASVHEQLPRLTSFWVAALVGCFLLSVSATFRGGYIGPDYPTHLTRLIEWPKIFDFSTTSPPTYYLLGHALFLLIGPNNSFPITLSIVQAAINTAALWWFFRYSEQRFRSPLIHLALVVFLAFLPVRVIHATTIGTDCTTIPLFVLLLYCFDRFRLESTSTISNGARLGLALSLAVLCKYSFMSALPAGLAIFTCLWIRRKWRINRFFVTCAVSLLLPSLISLYSFWASARVHGYNTEKHWLPKGAAADMDYKDLSSLKSSDIALFEAPEYFKSDIRAAHKHSYLALSHLGVFTDPLNLFQKLTVPQSVQSILIPDQKARRPWKTQVMRLSTGLGVVWTLAALIGTAWASFRAAIRLWQDRLEREDVAALLGVPYFLLMFLPIPFVYAGALFGYWTPRLILPSLLYFFLAAFLLIDQTAATRFRKLDVAVLLLGLVQAVTEIVMLS
jgi:4-amino-4-deoxy-L-arabinose transferase-like glycosyltransferase